MKYESGLVAENARETALPDDVEEAGARARRRRWIVIGLVALAVVVAAWFLLRGGSAAPAGPVEQLPVVTVVQPGRQTVTGMINATGTLAARRPLPVGVVGEGGRVLSVAVDAGSWVRQGQVLAVIDRSVQSQQAQAASAQINVARADAELAQANLTRAQALVGRGFISKAEVDRLTAQRDAARARVRVAEASYRELLARNARLNIVAPAAGLVLERAVEPGQTVGGGGAPLFTIAQNGEMELLARVGEADLARLSTGISATVTPVGSDRSFSGQIWQLAPVISAEDRQGTARVALGYSPELRPGGFATAVIRSGTMVAPVLPESAVMTDDQGDYVYIVDAEDRVVKRPVVQGDVTPAGIVISEGLSGTERVVLRAGGFLNPGEKIKPVAAGS